MNAEFDYESSFQRWKSLIEEGNHAYAERRYTAAEAAFNNALKEAEAWPTRGAGKLQDELDSRLTKSLNNMAALYHAQGKYRMAEELYIKALDIKQRLYGQDNDETAVALLNLATLFSAKRDYPQAEAYFIRTLQIREKVLGPNHPDLAKTLQKYALLLGKLGRSDEAGTMESRAMKILAHETSEVAES